MREKRNLKPPSSVAIRRQLPRPTCVRGEALFCALFVSLYLKIGFVNTLAERSSRQPCCRCVPYTKSLNLRYSFQLVFYVQKVFCYNPFLNYVLFRWYPRLHLTCEAIVHILPKSNNCRLPYRKLF